MRRQKNYDSFVDNEFSSRKWSAKNITSPEEIEKGIRALHLEGRTIKRMKFIGLCYNLRREWIEESVYNKLEGVDEELRQLQSDYDSIAPETPFIRWAEIDEPFMIEFEDGDSFEIDTPQAPEYCFSMNRIPWYIDAGTNLPNAEANTLFSSAIGKKITAVEVKIVNLENCPEHFISYPMSDDYVAGITLRLENGLGLHIYGSLDFCEVELIDENGNDVPITFAELKEGLFNWEDIHVDPATDFWSSSYTMFFGKKGAEYTDEPYMTIIPKGINTTLNISVNDFDLLAWSFNRAKSEIFDEYGDYEFSKNEWLAIISEAEQILSFKSFDKLFDYMTSLDLRGRTGINIPLNCLNLSGAEFWRKHRKYEVQIESLKKWTEEVLPSCEGFTMYGF